MTQSLPRQRGRPSADNSSRRGEQPQQAPGQTTVNQSTSPLLPLFVAPAPPLDVSLLPSTSTPLLHSVHTPENSGSTLQPREPRSELNERDAPAGIGRGADEGKHQLQMCDCE